MSRKPSLLFPVPSSYLLGAVVVIFLAFCLAYSCTPSGDEERAERDAYDMPADHAFVGDRSCRSCHYEEWQAWKGSHHDHAMAEAGQQTVHGDFNDVTFSEGEDTYRFFREDGAYMVEAPGPDGEPGVYEILYTFGWEPLQQYLVDFGRGKLQALHIAWDTERERWFTLYPDEQIEPDDWLHWTGGAMNWNTMCADCHSTNLQKNYIAEADSFHTTWSAINVSCEACHGPGGQHVEFAGSEEGRQASAERIRQDLNLGRGASQLEEIHTCAPCHSLRQELTADEYVPGFRFMDHYDPLLPNPENYHPDGQIDEEAFEFASFLQSKMHRHDVQCTDCHNPHTLELRATIHDNRLCMDCHEPEYNTPEHHFHEVNTEASQCVSCHMTGQYYMVVDYRRDHSFRVPRPDLSEQYGVPNSCNECHGDRTPAWAAEAIGRWYGGERPAHYSERLLKAHAEGQGAVGELTSLIADTSQADIVRATAVWYVGRFPTPESFDLLEGALESDSPLIRSSAAKALEELPEEFKKPLLTRALRDPVRAVRLSAVRGLAGYSNADFLPDDREHFTRALEEYKEQLDINQYFPRGQMSRGQFYEHRGEIDKAIDAYRLALKKDPYFNPPRVNLAYLYNSRGQNDRAEELLKTVIEQEPEFGDAYYSLALLLAEQDKLQEALTYFEGAAERMPGHSRVFYNWAIALQTLDRPDEAEPVYRQAIDLEPDNPDYRYGILTLYMQQGRYEQALEQAETMDRLRPNQPQIQQLLQQIRRQMQ